MRGRMCSGGTEEERALERPRMGMLVWSTADGVVMAELESSYKLGTFRNRSQAGISSDHLLPLQPRESVLQASLQQPSQPSALVL